MKPSFSTTNLKNKSAPLGWLADTLLLSFKEVNFELVTFDPFAGYDDEESRTYPSAYLANVSVLRKDGKVVWQPTQGTVTQINAALADPELSVGLASKLILDGRTKYLVAFDSAAMPRGHAFDAAMANWRKVWPKPINLAAFCSGAGYHVYTDVLKDTSANALAEVSAVDAVDEKWAGHQRTQPYSVLRVGLKRGEGTQWHAIVREPYGTIGKETYLGTPHA